MSISLQSVANKLNSLQWSRCFFLRKMTTHFISSQSRLKEKGWPLAKLILAALYHESTKLYRGELWSELLALKSLLAQKQWTETCSVLVGQWPGKSRDRENGKENWVDPKGHSRQSMSLSLWFASGVRYPVNPEKWSKKKCPLVN